MSNDPISPTDTETLCRAALEEDADDVQPLQFLGALAFRKNSAPGALGHYEAALQWNANLLPESLCDAGTALARSGKLEEAIGLYRRVLTINPAHRPARINLAQMLRWTEKHDESIAVLTRLLQESPGNLSTVRQLGVTCAAAHKHERALACFNQILAAKPDDAQALQYIANIHQAAGNGDQAASFFRRALAFNPLVTINVTQAPPVFRALFVFAPGVGNTPVDGLVDRAAYEVLVLNFLPDVSYNAATLRERADVVVNLVADVDQGLALLAPVADLIDRIGKPVVNPPRKIMRTDRESAARLLQDVPDCVVPKTEKFFGRTLREGDCGTFAFPFLARLAGTHGGTDFEKVHDAKELAAFVEKRPEADYYLTEYVDVPQIPLHLRERRDFAVSSRHRRQMENPPCDNRHGEPSVDAGGGKELSRTSGNFLQCTAICRARGNKKGHRSRLFRHRLRSRPQRPHRRVRGQRLHACPPA
jgi:tetratricopeptide (TPR) repeat protein